MIQGHLAGLVITPMPDSPRHKALSLKMPTSSSSGHAFLSTGLYTCTPAQNR
jgi:hypothetical protein